MFIGVVENLFQTSDSGFKSISRLQMQALKKVWVSYSDRKTGYLKYERFGAFFSQLSGVFEVRIYPVELSIPNILSACRPTATDPYHSIHGVNLDKLRVILNAIDYKEIRKRRATYCRLYQEASISHEPGLGISFTNMLLLLAQHKLIINAEALILQGFVARTVTNKHVAELIDLDRVRSLLKTIASRRRFLELRAQRFENVTEIPSIVVQDIPDTPMSSSPTFKRISQGDHSLATDNSFPGSRFQRGVLGDLMEEDRGRLSI